MTNTSDRCDVSMFSIVFTISCHGPSKDITYSIFEWETKKNSGQSTQFLGFGKDLPIAK
jgi:hypothetical protein